MLDARILNLPAIVFATVITACWSQLALADQTVNPFRSATGLSGGVALAQGQCGQGKCGRGMMRRGGKCGMQRMDADGDGKVTKDEFMKGHEDMFSRIDKNGDGVIDTGERDAHMHMMRSRKGRCGPGKCGQGNTE